MLGTWTKLWIEMYGPGGYKGSWEVNPAPGRTFTPADVRRHIADIRAKPEYAESEFRLCEDESDIIIGVFTGVRPRGPAKSGTDLDELLESP